MANLLRKRQPTLDSNTVLEQVWDHQVYREDILKQASEKVEAQKRANEGYIFGLGRDFTAMKDYASALSGGTVVQTLTTATTSGNNEPNEALDESLNPGSCWQMGSSVGQLGVRFTHPITITNITVDHVSKYVVSHVSDAPRKIKIWGLKMKDVTISPPHSDAPDSPATLTDHSYTYHFLLEGEYDPYKSVNIQTYTLPLPDQYTQMDGIVLGVLSNWGHRTTCLYRVRVHSMQS